MYLHICMYMQLYKYVICVYICICTCIYVYVHIYDTQNLSLYVYEHMHVYKYIYIYYMCLCFPLNHCWQYGAGAGSFYVYDFRSHHLLLGNHRVPLLYEDYFSWHQPSLAACSSLSRVDIVPCNVSMPAGVVLVQFTLIRLHGCNFSNASWRRNLTADFLFF